MRWATAIALAATLAQPARADDETRARGHYEIGLGLYRLGNYRGALKEFAAGYELAHKPGFLLNLGQTYRKLGELREARDLYRQFLAEARPDDTARRQAQEVLGEIEEALRRQPPPEPPPAVAPAPPPQAAPEARAPAPAVQLSTPAPARQRRGVRVAGLALGIVGVGFLGGGIGAAVAADSVARDLNAIDRSGGLFDPGKDSAYKIDRGLEGGLFAAGAALSATGVVLLVVGWR